jgi:23S rRNA pseudouridine1911/1915/1917 synthase
MAQESLEFVVEHAGERLDKLLTGALPEFSRSQIQGLIEAGAILVDGKAAKPGNKLRIGQLISVSLPDEGEDVIEPEEIALHVVYEDQDIAVIDKPAGMVVHPGIAQERGTLVNALLARYPEMVDMQDDPRAEGRMGIVHRLDKETSGLMVTARHIDALANLMAQFKARTTEKIYIAMLERAPATPRGVIEAPIGRDPHQRKRMSVVRSGKPATTEYEVIDDQFRDGRCLVKIRLQTGRTHQIRVHMAFLGCPIVGDTVYGFRKQRTSMKRNFLHAAELAFDHPRTGERMHFTSELPAGLKNIMDKLRAE